MSNDRRRQDPRIKADVVVDYTGTEVLLYHQVENISLGGMCMRAPSIEPVGIPVNLCLNFPDLNVTIDVKGEVVWSNEEPPRDMGVRFINLTDSDKDTIRQYIELKGSHRKASES